jgi:phosphatidylglycerophosphatase A
VRPLVWIVRLGYRRAMTEPLAPGPSTPPRAPRAALVIATFFGAGMSPKAPGTMGSLASLALWAPLVLLETPWWMRALVTLGVLLVGTVASSAIVKAQGREDPQIIVIDEVAGMGVTLLAAHGGPSLLLGFALFRLFDIWKPWPVRLADRRVKGGFGVMLDDVLAGLYALAGVALAESFL